MNIAGALRKFGSTLLAVPQLMRVSFIELQKNDPLRLAGATAFFSTFALPPILIIFIQLFGFFSGEKNISKALITRLGSLMGRNSALQLKTVLENISGLNRQWYIATLGFIFLLFVATTLFTVIRNSLNQIWTIRVVSKPGIFFTLKLRVRAFGIIMLAGLLFMSGLIVEGIKALLGDYLVYIVPRASSLFDSAIDEVFFILVVTIWFTMLFRFLTDGKPAWKVSWAGGIFTALLFTLGKVILKKMLALSNISTIYGTSGSIVLILLFVFYSSLMFYFGGCFVKALSDKLNCPILPHSKAFRYELQEIIKDEGRMTQH